MSQKLIHFAFAVSIFVLLVGLSIDHKKVSNLSYEKNKIEQIEVNNKLQLKVNFSSTITVLGNFVENIMHKLLNDNCCSKIIDKKDNDAKCVS